MSKVKICGLKRIEDINYVNEAMPDYIGFIFAKSKRYIDINEALNLRTNLNNGIKVIGVFVNEDINKIKEICDKGIIDIIQLHGDEDNNYIMRLKSIVQNKIIKAIRVKKKIEDFNYLSDYYLFDTYTDGEYGGTGKSFNWELLSRYNKEAFLAGGLNEGNIISAIKLVKPYCVDISSGVEVNGKKNREKIINIINLVRSIE